MLIREEIDDDVGFHIHSGDHDWNYIFLLDVVLRMPSSGIWKPSSYLTRNTLRLRYRVQPVKFEVFTAVTMKSALFWGIKSQFIPHERHIRSLIQGPNC
jgi:hypothetical protein